MTSKAILENLSLCVFSLTAQPPQTKIFLMGLCRHWNGKPDPKGGTPRDEKTQTLEQTKQQAQKKRAVERLIALFSDFKHLGVVILAMRNTIACIALTSVTITLNNIINTVKIFAFVAGVASFGGKKLTQ